MFIFLTMLVLVTLSFIYLDELMKVIYFLGKILTLIFNGLISCFLLLGVLLFVGKEKLNPANYKEEGM